MTKTHRILMLACCLVGLGAAAAIFLFNVPINTVFFGLMILVCPLSHLLMMRFMNHGQSNHSEEHHQQEQEKAFKENASRG